MSSQLRKIQTIYYLPGHGGRITNGLGQALVARGYEVVGRETVGDFKKLDFNDQVTTIANDIKEHFWREDAKIVANSFGGYLLLHALSKLDPYIGKVLWRVTIELCCQKVSRSLEKYHLSRDQRHHLTIF